MAKPLALGLLICTTLCLPMFLVCEAGSGSDGFQQLGWIFLGDGYFERALEPMIKVGYIGIPEDLTLKYSVILSNTLSICPQPTELTVPH